MSVNPGVLIVIELIVCVVKMAEFERVMVSVNSLSVVVSYLALVD